MPSPRRRGLAMTRFDYSGHGRSSGRFEDGTISRWLEESLAVFDRTEGPQIVVGSSMGGWLALLLGEAHRAAVGAAASRIAGLVLIAPAVDMTRALMWEKMNQRAAQGADRDRGLSARRATMTADRLSSSPGR